MRRNSLTTLHSLLHEEDGSKMSAAPKLVGRVNTFLPERVCTCNLKCPTQLFWEKLGNTLFFEVYLEA